MLKFITDSLDGIDESLRGLYEQDGDKYRLKIEGLPQPEDTSGLKAKVDELLAEKKSEAEKRKAAEEAARKAAEEAARKSGDVEALDKSWQEKLSKRERELLDQLESHSAQVRELTVGRAATELATELAVSGSAKALLPHIQARLGMDMRDGRPTVVVLDADGKPSAATLAELKNEFASDPAFAPLIVGTRATGGGASGAKHGGGAAKRFTDYTGAELSAIRKSDPALYERLKSDHYGTGA